MRGTSSSFVGRPDGVSPPPIGVDIALLLVLELARTLNIETALWGAGVPSRRGGNSS